MNEILKTYAAIRFLKSAVTKKHFKRRAEMSQLSLV